MRRCYRLGADDDLRHSDKRNTGILIARGVDLGLAALLVSLMQLRVEDTVTDTIELVSGVGCGFLGAV